MRVVESSPSRFRMVDWPKLQSFAVVVALVAGGFGVYGARRTVLVCGPEPEPACRIETTWLLGPRRSDRVPFASLRGVSVETRHDSDMGAQSRIVLATDAGSVLVGRPSGDVDTIERVARRVQDFLDSGGEARLRFTDDRRTSDLMGFGVVALLLVVFLFFAEVTVWDVDRLRRVLVIRHARPFRRREVRVALDDIETIVASEESGDGWALGTVVTKDGRRMALFPFTFKGFFVPLYKRHVATLMRALDPRHP